MRLYEPAKLMRTQTRPDRRAPLNRTLSNPVRYALRVLSLLFLAGCAFDVSHVRQQPVQFRAVTSAFREFVLLQEVKVKLGSGFPTVLKAGTRWRQIGSVEQGDVYATKDQVVMVEASNNYEAQLVVAGSCVKGFYLPVEKTFVAVSKSILLPVTQTNPNPP